MLPASTLFAIKPDQPLTLDALIAIHRDAFEGTPFDMTTGDGAGLFASPYRYGKISCEQAIASLITGYTWITQANANLPAPVAWISLDTARENPFIPLAVALMPQGYEQVDRTHYDSSKAFWTYSQTADFARGVIPSLPLTSVPPLKHSRNKSRTSSRQTRPSHLHNLPACCAAMPCTVKPPGKNSMASCW